MQQLSTTIFVSLLFLLMSITNHTSAQENTVRFETGEQQFEANATTFDSKKKLASSEIYGDYFYRFIEFNEIPTTTQHQQIKAKGIELLEYIPNKVYLAAIPLSSNFREWQSLGIRSLQPIGKQFKKSKRLQKDIPAWAMEGNFVNVSIQYYANIDGKQLEKELLQIGAYVQERFHHANMLDIQIEPKNLDKLMAQSYVRFVDLMSEPGEPESDDGRNLHRSNAIDNDYFGGRNYDGTGVNIAINDDGFAGPHIDFTGRTNQQTVINDLTGDHGDMVAGVAGGAGNLDPVMRGMAPGSYMHIRQYRSNMSGTLPLHQDSAVLVFNSSYSNGCGAGYTNTTVLVDQEIYNNPTLMQVFSAGNSNNQDCGYGAGNQWGNITGGHKEGKNVIATANLSETDQIIASSSRGPAVDGRIKPDIAAHGNSQMSTDPNNTYAPGGGTSAAAPGIAGVMAQLHHAYRDLNSGTTAPSGLLKATMMNTANDLGNDGPDFIYGWGKVNALKAVKLLEENRYFQDSLTQGDSVLHMINIPANVLRAKVMVYWVDQEGSTNSAIALVNDLDASMTDASNTNYLPWVLNSAPNTAALSSPATKGVDRLNNVEQVAIDNPAAGAYTLKVKGTTIPFGTHKYWVVYEFLYNEITVTFPMGGEGLLPGTSDRIHWDAYGDAGTFTIEYSTDGGSSWNNIGVSAGNTRFRNWSVPAVVTGQGLIRVSRNGVSDVSDATFSVVNRPNNIRVTRVCPNVNEIQLEWDAVNGATAYDVFLLGQKYMDSIGSTTALQYNVSVPDVTQEYWLSVRATGPNGLVGRRQIAELYTGSVGGGAPSCFLACTGDNDAGVSSISSPATTIERCNGATAIPVTVDLENLGLFTETNFEIYYQLGNNPIVTDTITANLNSGGSVTHTFDTPLMLPNTGNYTLKIWTGLATDRTTCNDTLTQVFDVYDPVAGFPYVENFESGVFPPTASFLSNPDNGQTWTTRAVSGSDGNATTAMYVSNFSYNARGQEDIFRILTLDLNTGVNPLLTFDVAYREYSATYSDGLRVEISTDCGQTYTPAYLKTGANLTTGAAVTTNWAPTAAADWRNDSIDLTPYLGNNVTIRFINICDYGQNLYVDNINVQVSGLAPVTNFEANTQLSCLGTIEFSDRTGNQPNSWLWNFGDGNTSTQQNPTHTYANPGTYTVTLTTTNPLGTDTEIKTSYITVALPSLSSVQNGEGCPNTSIALGVTGTGQPRWYDMNNNVVNLGNNFNTPVLANTTTYQVQDAIPKPSQFTQPTNPSFGSGGYHGSAFTGAINFTADTGFILVSAWVDADGAGDRVVYLWDGNIANGGGAITNTVLQQVTITLVDGPQRVNLNLEVPGAGNYALGGNNMNLYRNNGGTNYPYVLPGVVSLNSSTAGTPANFYYYFYDLEIQLAPCVGPLQPVTATIIESDFNFTSNGNSTSFTDNSTGATSWFWDFGDGNTSTQQNPTHTYAATGNYTVTLTINNACSSQDVVSFVTSVATLGEQMKMALVPNPTTDQTTLRFNQPIPEDIQIEVLAVDGKLLQSNTMTKGQTNQVLDLTSYPAAVYLVRMYSSQGVDIRKLVKE